MRIPRIIYIENNRWKVKRKNGLKHIGVKCYGICDYDNRTIVIETMIKDSLLMETLVHEITHALMHELKIKVSFEDDESVADSVGRTMTQIFNLRLK